MLGRYRSSTSAVASALLILSLAASELGCDKKPEKSSAAPDAAVGAVGDASSSTSAPQIPPGPGKPRAPITSYGDALATLRAAWVEEIAPPTATHSAKADAHANAVLGGRLRARQLTCRQAHQEATLLPSLAKPNSDLVLFATIPAINRDGTCWEIVATDATADIHVYFDAKTGTLLSAFLTPLGG